MMEHQRWERIHELFHQALALEASARAAFLDGACGGDQALRDELQALLTAHGSEFALLDGGPERLVTVLGEEADAPLPRRIGAYRVLRELGRGGMGVVYLAEREDADFRQVVALKCILAGVASPDVIGRFRRERRILAGLVHPNIAQLHDGGLTETGDPYFVMEYVAGEPLDEFCDRRRLDIDARLALFATVCEAVQYAHEHLVVHRDLKPGNVLVTAEGRVKLLDFGVAKLLGEDGSGEAMTRTTHALTPVYASPEQLRGEPVTAASDVFSLGLMLFELLTGQRAFSPVPGPFGSIRAVLETEPARASAAATIGAQRSTAEAFTAPLEARAAARRTTPERLRRRLRGDLDTIVERALRRDASERYASAQALLADIRRHLQKLPIEAQPPTTLYRAGKFVRRHRTGVAAAAAVLFALVGGLGAAVWQGAVAARERDFARAEAAKAERVTEFLAGVFAAADPYAPGERLDTLRVSALLERGATRVRVELAGQPEIQVPLLRAMGRAYRMLPDLDAAEPLIRDAVALARAAPAIDHAELAESLTELAFVLRSRGRLEDSETHFREAVDILRSSVGDADPRVTRGLSRLAAVVMSRGRLDEADSLLTLALARARVEPAPDSAVLADILTRHGMLANAKGDHETAIRSAHEALAINRALLGPAHPRSIGDLNNVAVFLQRAGRHEEAESAYREAVALQRQALGKGHPNAVGLLAAHAAALHRIGRHEEAREAYREAVALSSGLPAGLAAYVHRSYAAFLQSRGEVGEAERLYREAIATLDAALSDQDPERGVSRLPLAALLCTTGRQAAGVALYEAALATLTRLLPADHREVQRARTGLTGCRSGAPAA